MEELLEKMITSNKPQTSREDTVKLMKAMIDDGLRPATSEVHGPGPLLFSDIPANARTSGVIMGIDEAGRGPVLGPMTYGAAFWSPDDDSLIPKGFNDSKVLTGDTRSALFDKTLKTPQIGFLLRILHASEISRNMLRTEPYNLNAMSHDAAIEMIRAVLDAGVKIDTCYIDTVGIASNYQSMLERVFNGLGIRFVVEKKADAKYVQCSVASVVAKVARDRMMESWRWAEPHYEAEGGHEFGSGYPSDPKCKQWMEKNLADRVFCYPSLVRFSWGPAKDAIKNDGVVVEWEADEDEENNGVDSDGVKRQQLQMNAFLSSGKDSGSGAGASTAQQLRKQPRLAYFAKRRLVATTKLYVE
jgi:ribonuclease H2 subunit A